MIQLLVRRRHPGSETEVAVVFAFEKEPVTLTLPLAPGHWTAVFESTDARWGGPGASWPMGIVAGGTARLTLPAGSATVFEKD